MTEAMMMSGETGGGRIRAMKVDYPSNARPANNAGERKDKPPLQPVTTGTVIERPKSFFRKLTDAFVGESEGNVTDYLLFEVLIPAAKNLISDVVSEGVNRVLFTDGRRPGGSQGARAGFTSYNTIRPARPDSRVTTRRRGSHSPDMVITQTRGEAEDVLDGLRTIIGQYGVASVGDFHALTGTETTFIDENWGWTDLRSATIRPTRGGYLIVVPDPVPLS